MTRLELLDILIRMLAAGRGRRRGRRSGCGWRRRCWRAITSRRRRVFRLNISCGCEWRSRRCFRFDRRLFSITLSITNRLFRRRILVITIIILIVYYAAICATAHKIELRLSLEFVLFYQVVYARIVLEIELIQCRLYVFDYFMLRIVRVLFLNFFDQHFRRFLVLFARLVQLAQMLAYLALYIGLKRKYEKLIIFFLLFTLKR
jgi:hypothetical protein